MSYVYIKSEPSLWTVGFYEPDGNWVPESDHRSSEEAAARVATLNGGAEIAEVVQRVERLERRLSGALEDIYRVLRLLGYTGN